MRILAFAPIIAWVCSWLLYAFGQLTEDTHVIREQGTKIENIDSHVEVIAKPIIMEAEEKARRHAEEKEKSDAQRRTGNEACQKNTSFAGTASFAATEKGTIICAQCNTEQPANRRLCWVCAAKFETK